MLAKLKHPSMYVNRGVWFFPHPNDFRPYPIKRKIVNADIRYVANSVGTVEWTVKHLYLKGVGWVVPESVFMTSKEARNATEEIQVELILKDAHYLLDEAKRLKNKIANRERILNILQNKREEIKRDLSDLERRLNNEKETDVPK